jgi:hypothetical protein
MVNKAMSSSPSFQSLSIAKSTSSNCDKVFPQADVSKTPF